MVTQLQVTTSDRNYMYALKAPLLEKVSPEIRFACAGSKKVCYVLQSHTLLTRVE